MLELGASGLLIQMTPNGGDTGARNTLLLFALQHDARTHGGWKQRTGSSATVPDVSPFRSFRVQPRCLPGTARALRRMMDA